VCSSDGGVQGPIEDGGGGFYGSTQPACKTGLMLQLDARRQTSASHLNCFIFSGGQSKGLQVSDIRFILMFFKVYYKNIISKFSLVFLPP
jgi:hypothetical protein